MTNHTVIGLSFLAVFIIMALGILFHGYKFPFERSKDDEMNESTGTYQGDPKDKF